MANSIKQLREVLCANADVAKLIIPSAKFEIYMDINGDGVADFAFIDTSCDLTGNGSVDTFAIDLGVDGEFDLYLKDTDGNFVADQITYFKDGTVDPVIQTHPEKSREMIEAGLAGPAQVITSTLKKLAAGECGVEEFKDGVNKYVMGARLALRNIWAAYSNKK